MHPSRFAALSLGVLLIAIIKLGATASYDYKSGEFFATTTGTDRKDNVVTAVLKFAPNGKSSTFTSEVAKGQPAGFAINRNGDLFVGITSADKFHQGDSIVKVSANNRQRTVFAKDLATPSNLTFDNAVGRSASHQRNRKDRT